MNRSMKLFLLSLISIAALSACNTTIGLGRDMRVLGTEMEKKAEQAYGGNTDPAMNDYSGGAPVY